MESPLVPLNCLAGSWQAGGTDLGYYIHRNRVYLQGDAFNGGLAVGATILTGMPAEMRPASDTAVTLIANVDGTSDPATPGVVLPLTLAATVTAGGDLGIAALPPFIAVAPNGGLRHWTPGGIVDDFTTPLSISLVLGNVSWPLGPAMDDSYAPESLAGYLAGGDFDDIDATILDHDARVHLDGRVRARFNGASIITPSLPERYTRGLTGGSSFTTGEGPAGRFAIAVWGGGRLQVLEDEDYDAYGLSIPNIDFNQDPFRGLTSHGWGRERTTLVLGGESWHPPIPDSPAHPGDVYWFDNAYTVGWDHGEYTTGWPGPLGLGLEMCLAPGATPSISASLEPYLSIWNPPPDWLVISTDVQFSSASRIDASLPWKGCDGIRPEGDGSDGPGGHCGPYIEPGPLVLSADAPFELRDDAWHPVPATAAAVPNPLSRECEWASLPTGFLARTDGGGYQANPSNPASKLLWRPGELTSVSLAITGRTNGGGYGLRLNVTPFWEKRKMYLKAGQVLDLTAGGWQSLLAGVAPGVVSAAPGQAVSGIRRRGQIRASAPAVQAAFASGNTIPGGGSGSANVLPPGDSHAGQGASGVVRGN